MVADFDTCISWILPAADSIVLPSGLTQNTQGIASRQGDDGDQAAKPTNKARRLVESLDAVEEGVHRILVRSV
jgi:hypothetical protein